MWTNAEGAPALGSLHDFSGNGNHGELKGDTRTEPGKFGNALSFDGSGDYVHIDNNPSTTDTSIIILVRPADIITSQYLCDFAGVDVCASILGFADGYYNIYGGAYPTGSASDTQILASGVGITDHLVWTISGTSLKGYLNGVELISETITSGDFAPATGLDIGRRYTSTFYFSGLIEQFLYYSRTLSPSEILSLCKEPFQMFRQQPIELWVGATSVDSGAIPLTGTITVVSSATATLEVTRGVAGTIDAVSSVVGTLEVNKPITGAIAAVSSTAGNLSVARDITGTITAVSAVNGNLTISGAVQLTGTIAAVSGASGNLSATKLIAGIITAVSATQAELTRVVKIVGTITAVSSTAGNLSTTRGLIGSVSASSMVLGDLGRARPLAGEVQAISAMAGNLAVSWALTGTIPALSMLTGTLGIPAAGPTLPEEWEWIGELIDEEGRALTITLPGSAADPLEPWRGNTTLTSTNAVGVFVRYRAKQVNSDHIRRGDQKVLLIADEIVNIEAGTKIIDSLDGSSWYVIRLKRITSRSNILLFILHVRQ